MRLFNTLTRQIEELSVSDNTVRIYLCGVTVYDDSHIGHARTIIIFDVLHRFLLSNGYKVIFVQNFTDVDDKIIKKAKSLGIDSSYVSSKYIKKYFEDFYHLNILQDVVYPKATDHISEMINIIKYLLDNKYAYITSTGIYFHVKKFPGYGKLSKKIIENLDSGVRIEIDNTKLDPLDFALWKFSSGSPVWNSPWGKGRPGWHIECSAMIQKHLHNKVDIHGGGNDLIFPHHENEIAQSETVAKKQFVKIWMHCGMVNINSEKMSKSLGNIISIGNVIKLWGPNTIRILCLSTQYSKPLDYSEANLSEALSKWRLIENCVYELRSPVETNNLADKVMALTKFTIRQVQERIKIHLDNDFNTPLALNEFMKFVSDVNDYAANEYITRELAEKIAPVFYKIMEIFGLRVSELPVKDIKKIGKLILQRNILRQNKEFEKADKIRKKLKNDFGIEIMDHKNNRTVWKKVEI